MESLLRASDVSCNRLVKLQFIVMSVHIECIGAIAGATTHDLFRIHFDDRPSSPPLANFMLLPRSQGAVLIHYLDTELSHVSGGVNCIGSESEQPQAHRQSQQRCLSRWIALKSSNALPQGFLVQLIIKDATQVAWNGQVLRPGMGKPLAPVAYAAPVISPVGYIAIHGQAFNGQRGEHMQACAAAC